MFRLSIGAMWWQATLWKLPPVYTDEPGQPFGKTGLAFWMIRLGKTAALQAQADFVNDIVLPHFYLFAPLVYTLEVLTAVSLILGMFVRFWGLIGALQAANLWLGLYNDYYTLAVDLFSSPDFDADLRSAPVWPQPRLRCHHRRPRAGPRFDCTDCARRGELSAVGDCRETGPRRMAAGTSSISPPPTRTSANSPS